MVGVTTLPPATYYHRTLFGPSGGSTFSRALARRGRSAPLFSRAEPFSPMYRQPDGSAQPSGGPSSSAEPCVCIDVPPDANPHLDRCRRSGFQKLAAVVAQRRAAPLGRA